MHLRHHHRKNLRKRKRRATGTGLIAAICVALAPAASAQDTELIETLLENGHLTREQAERLLEPSRSTLLPAGINFGDFQIRGRIQTHFGYAWADDDDGSDSYSTLELRRVQLGVQGTLPQSVRAQVTANFVPGSDVTLRSAFLQWREYDAARVKVGYDRPAFGFERTTSSRSIVTVERSHLTNTIISDDALGIAVDGNIAPFSYGVGFYTNRDNINPTAESDRYLYNASAGMSLDHLVPENHRLAVRTDLLFNDDAGGNIWFDEGFSLSAHYGVGPFDLRAEYLHADSFDGDKTHGWYVTPSYYVTEKFQVVGRYEWMESDAADGIRSTSRYSRRVSDLRGDSYRALYTGANYHFRGDANKVMFGVELSELEATPLGDQEAVTLYGAWRVSF